METSLHQQLKRLYAADESNTEVVLGDYRIDAIRGEELIEIQCASLSAIREKSRQLLLRHSLRVVKPIIYRTRIVKAAKAGGVVTSTRMSPKRGSLIDLFEELIYFTAIYPHPNLVLDVPMVHVRELRIPATRRRRRWQKEFQVSDVSLESVYQTHEFRTRSDLLELIAIPPETDSFDTSDLARWIERPRWLAQKIAYTLRHIGAIECVDRKRNGNRFCVTANDHQMRRAG